MSFVLFDIAGNELFASSSFFKDDFGKRVISSFDVVIDHITEKGTASSNRHMKFGQLFFSIFISREIA